MWNGPQVHIETKKKKWCAQLASLCMLAYMPDVAIHKLLQAEIIVISNAHTKLHNSIKTEEGNWPIRNLLSLNPSYVNYYYMYMYIYMHDYLFSIFGMNSIMSAHWKNTSWSGHLRLLFLAYVATVYKQKQQHKQWNFWQTEI